MDSDIFEPFEKLIEIEILGEKREVPENNNLLRCFQYLSMETISYGEFCWNGDCANCRIWLENTVKEENTEGKSEKEKTALACRTQVQEGMKIVRISGEIKIK